MYWVPLEPFDWKRPEKCCRPRDFCCGRVPLEQKKKLRKKREGKDKTSHDTNTLAQQALRYVVGTRNTDGQQQQTSKHSGSSSKKKLDGPLPCAVKLPQPPPPHRSTRRENRRENGTGTPKKVTRDRDDDGVFSIREKPVHDTKLGQL